MGIVKLKLENENVQCWKNSIVLDAKINKLNNFKGKFLITFINYLRNDCRLVDPLYMILYYNFCTFLARMNENLLTLVL